MPYRCAVPHSKRNYENGSKIIFSFPNDRTLSAKGTNAIKRMDFTPTKFSRVGILCIKKQVNLTET